MREQNEQRRLFKRKNVSGATSGKRAPRTRVTHSPHIWYTWTINERSRNPDHPRNRRALTLTYTSPKTMGRLSTIVVRTKSPHQVQNEQPGFKHFTLSLVLGGLWTTFPEQNKCSSPGGSRERKKHPWQDL